MRSIARLFGLIVAVAFVGLLATSTRATVAPAADLQMVAADHPGIMMRVGGKRNVKGDACLKGSKGCPL